MILVPLINVNSASMKLKETYLKILPVFLSYSEITKINIKIVLELIITIQTHPLFAKEKHLLNGWYSRFKDIKNWQEGKEPDKMMKKRLTTNDNNFKMIPGTQFIDTIGYCELDYFNSFHKFLKYHKLHKYLYIFANLSHLEIRNIDSTNIQALEKKVDIFPMTVGARNAILRRLTDLHLRSARLKSLCVPGHLSLVPNLLKAVEELKIILKTPIRSKTIYQNDDDLPGQIVNILKIMVESFHELQGERKIPTSAYNDLVSIFRKAWSCPYFTDAQKSCFNEWRYQIQVLLNKNNFIVMDQVCDLYRNISMNKVNMSADMNIHMFPVDVNSPITYIPLNGLDGLTRYLDQWLV